MEETIRRLLSRGPKKEREIKQGANASRSGLWVFETAKKNLEQAHEIRLDKGSGTWTLS